MVARADKWGCMACTMGMNAVDNFIQMAIKQHMLKILRSKCDAVDSKVERGLCESFTGKRGRQLADMIAEIFEPKTFCVMVGACEEKETDYDYDLDDEPQC